MGNLPGNLIKHSNNHYRSQYSLQHPRLHDDGRFRDSLMLKKMMKRRHQKQFLMKFFLPNNLEKTRSDINDKEQKKNNKRDENSHSHIENIEQ